MDPAIRTVAVELLRKGSPHNQLLSPLTEYLGICGESGAGSVTIPYEQATFNAQLSELRYGDDDEQDQAPRQRALRTLGNDLGQVLGDVPGMAGALLRSDGERLLNLRLVTSASELSMLPFELAKVPAGTGKPADEWLALAGARVCITRRVRSVEPSRQQWPSGPPRVLFIVGLDVSEELIAQHRGILAAALSPWSKDPIEARDLVEIRPQEATVREISNQLAEGFAHIHILAHGAESPATEAATYGLLLSGTAEDEVDIVTGDRFASILRSLPSGVARPATIVAASCDSAFQADVLTPGGSFAHALHLAGVPLVVASQFPLTTRASVSLTESIYNELLWGHHPLETIARARTRLHAEFAYTHDWASVVVYEALPDDLQLPEVRYQRARKALQRAQTDLAKGDAAAAELADRALGELPVDEVYQRECEGLRASHAKQLAEIAYQNERYPEARQQLMTARRLYRDAARRFLDPGSALQRHATLHWVQIQALTLDYLLEAATEPWAWWIAYRSASLELAASKAGEDYWARGSLAELWLLKLFQEELDDGERREAADNAREHIAAIRRTLGKDSFPVFSTQRQLLRYVKLWGDPRFAERLELERSPRWDEGELSVVNVATDLVAILDR